MIVIPMAGYGSRFQACGYTEPKFMLPVSGRPVFEWVMMSFSLYFQSENFLFITRQELGVKNFIRNSAKSLGILSYEVIELRDSTCGQAETVMLGINEIRDFASQLHVFNIDTIRPKCDLSTSSGEENWLEVFVGQGDGWSFVKPSNHNPDLVEFCTEKKRVSPYCSTGLYSFASGQLFGDALELERKSPTTNELYIAPLYNHLLTMGVDVYWRLTPESSVILSGIPEQYEILALEGLREEDFQNHSNPMGPQNA